MITKMSASSMNAKTWYRSMLAGNTAYIPVDPAMELISSTILATTATEVIFSSIPSTYKNLQIRITVRGSSGPEIYCRLNGDSGYNYAFHTLEGNGSSVVSSANSNYDWMTIGLSNSNSGGFTAMVLDVADYANTSKFKTTKTFSGFANGGSNALRFTSGLWRSTSAVNAIRLYPDGGTLTAGSRFSLYGIKG